MPHNSRISVSPPEVRGQSGGATGLFCSAGELVDQHEMRLRLQGGFRAAGRLGAVQECEVGRAGAGSRHRPPTQEFSLAVRWVSMLTPGSVDVLGVCLCVQV